MKYWPLSIIASSPLMPTQFLNELYAVQRKEMSDRLVSSGAIAACGHVARHTIPYELKNLAVIQTLGAPGRRLYLEHPSMLEWDELERACVVEGPDGVLWLVIDKVH